jgi:DNA helicase HerA-like ATPase
MSARPTLLGHVGAVTGASVSVLQSPTIGSGVAIIGGNSYRVGQVGSFVRIPQGYNDLYGIVTEVGATAAPLVEKDQPGNQNRWMTIQLLGEIVGASFERGISQYPSVNDEVHLVTEKDLSIIYGDRSAGQVVIGRLSNAEGIPVRLDLDKLVTRHCAVLGSTGSGKSTTVASLLRSIVCGGQESDDQPYRSARILVLDIHGEYGRALGSVAKIFRVGSGQGEEELFVPYWALDSYFLLSLLMGKLDDKQTASILDRIFAAKEVCVQNNAILGMEPNSLTSESPIPFSLKQLWLDLIDPELKTWANVARTEPALAPDSQADADTLTPPKYLPAGAGSAPPFLNQKEVLGVRRGLDQMRSRLLDRQLNFLLHPGDWEPNLEGVATKDLPELLRAWVGHEKPITILDLSGIPSAVLDHLIGAILKIIYEGLFWGRDKSEGGISRPLLVVMDEAHRYLSKEHGGPGLATVQRIMREGRKFGIGAMVISQRPSEVNETLLSQCGTFIALRLSNSTDRARVQATLPDSLVGLVESLPILRIGEAVITGEAARLPIRCRITLPAEEYRPSSEDPLVSASWLKSRIAEGYDRVVASWRSQNPRWVCIRPTRVVLQPQGEENMERIPVESSTAVSVGYDGPSQTLEVEFKSGIYQYYNVPQAIHEQMMVSESIGKFIHTYIKPAYPCSRV